MRRQLFRTHRATMLIDWGAIARYHGTIAEQVRVIAQEVQEDDESKRYEEDEGGGSYDVRRLDSCSFEGGMDLAAPPKRSKGRPTPVSTVSQPSLFGRGWLSLVSRTVDDIGSFAPLESAGVMPETPPAFRCSTSTPRAQVQRLIGGTGFQLGMHLHLI